MPLVFRTLLLVLFVTPMFPAEAVEVFFSPGRDCEIRIIDAANNSKKEIVAAVYSINHPDIVNALKAAHQRGINVRILTDRTQASGQSSRVLELLRAGIGLRVHSKHKIEHNKFGVFDDKVAISGSFNWTVPASRVNSENCVVMSETSAIAAYKKRFIELWEMNSEAKSKEGIAKIERKRSLSKGGQ